MSKYLGHFDVHYVEIGDNTYLDILTEEDKEILEYLGKCEKFRDRFFDGNEFDIPPEELYFKEITDEEADVISKYVRYCKSYYEYIGNGLDDLYYNKFGDWPEESFTLEQVKQLVDDTNS